MSRTPIQAQPPLEFIPPAFNPTLVRGIGAALPLWMKLKTPLAQVEVKHAERLAKLYSDFQAGKARFLVAFRHPSTYDPLCMANLCLREVPRAAQAHNIPLKKLTGSYFLYDRGVPLWAGSLVGWLMPRVGGISVQRGKLDRQSLRTTRELFATGDFPLMAAPEGATNGHSEVVGPLEPGVAQMGFWCMEDRLTAELPSVEVSILPVSIRYSYIDPPWEALDGLLGEIEVNCGLEKDSKLDRFARLNRIGERLLLLVSQFYSRFYQQEIVIPPGADFNARLQALLEAALRVAEQYFNLQAKGTIIDRCRRIEQAGWERIYREDLKEANALTPVERGLADRVAEESDLRMWHMRLVESFVAVTGAYIAEKPTADRFAEVVLIAHKTMQRLEGVDTFSEPDLGKKRALLVVGEPISINQRWEGYKASRQGAKQAVADLTATIQTAFQTMIKD
jgi:1-acyl-sn-glycerol-3-phosphate acyltransferase